MMERYPFWAKRGDLTKEIEWVPLAHFRAMPGGVVRREAYEEMKDEILGGLQKEGVLDGVFFDIHGAMSVEGLDVDPAESDLTVVKIGYLEPELRAMAADHVLLLSKGGVNPALETVEYTKLQRPMFPLEREFAWEPKATVCG